MRRFGLLVGAWLLVWAPLLGHAQSSQFTLKEWTSADGSPGYIYAIAQTTDGTLWIGGSSGLTRFDGLRFVHYPQAGDPPLRSHLISALRASPDGGLWIGFRFGGVALIRNGHVVYYDANDGLPPGTVFTLVWDRQGNLWAATNSGLARLHGERWEASGPTTNAPVYEAYFDRRGNLWVLTDEGIFMRPARGGEFQQIARSPGQSIGNPQLTESPDTAVWARTAHGLSRFMLGSDGTVATSVLQADGITAPLLFDRAGALWLGGSAAHVLPSAQQITVGTAAVTKMMSPASGSKVETYFQDREGNIWVGTQRGLERFTRNNVSEFPSPPCGDWGYGLARRPSAVLWITCSDPDQQPGIWEARAGSLVGPIHLPYFTATYADPQGATWFGGAASLYTSSPDGRLSSQDRPAGTDKQEIQAIVQDASGALWVSIVRRGVFRLKEGQWSANGGLTGLPKEPAIVATRDPSMALWFGYTNNRIARVRDRDVRLLGSSEGLSVGNVTAIATFDADVWVGGELGLERFDGTRFEPVWSASGQAITGVTGLVRNEAGDFWLNGDRGITRIARAEVERVRHEPGYRVRSETYNALDGVLGTAQPLRPIPSAVETSDGRLWFATTTGVVLIDPTRIAHNALPPPVTIWSITSAGVRYPLHSEEVFLPMHTTQLRIEFTAGSLTVPERVGFRYMLEGFDRSWQDSGGRREAFYTNLSPGEYRFRVIASNNDGVWNNQGAWIRLRILPAFYQTRWFYVLCGLLCLLVLTLLYKLRMAQISAQVRSRLEERMAERERIARELHDTLLQGVQGLILRFQAAADGIPTCEPARSAMERTLQRADGLLAESRARVKDLRDVGAVLTALPEALAAEGEQLGLRDAEQFRVSTEGQRRSLHRIVRDEVILIVREAIANAVQHARAKRIEVQLCYEDSQLRIMVRDDGCGFDARALIAAHGDSRGHFGLRGMRERARKLSGHLEIWSTDGGAGTEVSVRVPARVAYNKTEPTHWRSWSNWRSNNTFEERE